MVPWYHGTICVVPWYHLVRTRYVSPCVLEYHGVEHRTTMYGTIGTMVQHYTWYVYHGMHTVYLVHTYIKAAKYADQPNFVRVL
jgi:hypothetical protein